jgi:HD-GYP domain-containing protein (c-di-GMP phosphodiesterase class II)
MEKPLVLLLDDEPDALKAFSLLLQSKFDVESVTTTQDAIDAIQTAEGTINVAVVDMKLDDDPKGGLKAIQEIRRLEKPPEIIVLTAYGSPENTVECMEAGAFSYVDKSEGAKLLIETIYRALEIHTLRRDAEFARYVPSFIQCLATVIDSHEPYTAGHSRRVAKCSRMIAEKYGLRKEECDDIEMAGNIHDLGKVGIDICTLTRASKFTNIEWAMIREHPREGERILKSIPELAHLSPPVVEHHERYDGNGYPYGKRADEISIQGRIMAVADTFDAMVSERPYQKELTFEEAFDAITNPDSPRHRPGQFDPKVVEAFKAAFEQIKTVYRK